MTLLRQRLKSSVERRRSLEGIPRLNDGVRIEEISPKAMAVKVPIRRGEGFFERFAPPISERRYELDEFGAFVVRQLKDGVSVMAIVRAFEAEFGMSHRECELSVVAFIKMLIKRGVLHVEMDSADGDSTPAA